MIEVIASKTVTLTESAATKIKSLMEDQPDGVILRIFVQGGGCSGFEYGFSFDNIINETDTITETFGASLIVDQMSMNMINGSVVDYVKSLQSEGFEIKNPLSVGGCGCGKSFTLADTGNVCEHVSDY